MKQVDDALGSVLPSVCLFACAAKNNKSHYQSKVFVCLCNQGVYTDNSAHVVDQLLI